MNLTDPIADFLTRIRNAQKARLKFVEVPVSNIKVRLAEIFAKEGFLSGFQVLPGKLHKMLRLDLRYVKAGEPIISEIRRISRPGCRIYASSSELASRRSVVATTIVTTSKGVMTDEEALASNLGGELICTVM